MIVLQNNRNGKSFLEVGDVQIPNNYETQMLMANSFKYIAEGYFREVDNERVMAFRIDGLTLLTDFYSRLRPTKKELEILLKDLSRVIREL